MSRNDKLVTTAAVLVLLAGLAACGSDGPATNGVNTPAEPTSSIPATVARSAPELHAFMQGLTEQQPDKAESLLLGETILPGDDDTEVQSL